MARNRKRRPDRRPPRAAGSVTPEADLVTANRARGEEARIDEAPGPIEHATQPDDSTLDRSGEAGRRAVESGEVELAEAQLAAGRVAAGDEDAPLTDEELLEAEELDAAEGGRGGNGNGRRAGARRGGVDGPGGSGGGELAVAGETRPERSASVGSRVVQFLQGSWRELQRVQWPDRRQVIQATGVVIGFVVVAGVFLGVADFVAQKIVNLILK